MKRIITFLLIIASCLPIISEAQTVSKDSLSLQQIIQQVLQSYPSIKKAEIEIESANASIGAARTAYNPLVDISSRYTHEGPVSKITIPSLGTFSFRQADNYNAMVSVDQQLYDFGRTSRNIDLQKQTKQLSEMTLEQLKQQLSRTLIGNYYNIVYLQEAIRIKDEELKNLYEHLQFIEKKASTGSATQFEILTTKVRISNIENQKTDLQSGLSIQSGVLNSFLGQPQQAALYLKKEFFAPTLVESLPSLIDKASDQREEMKIVQQKSVIAKANLDVVNSKNNPILSAFANGGVQNGYSPDLGRLKANYLVGVGFKFPLFDRNKSKHERIQAKNNQMEVEQETELTKRNISNEVIECKVNVDAALKKTDQTALQLKQAQQAYNLAQTSFKAGVITNLDLLDSSTALAESELNATKSNIDYTVNLLKLKIALGERIY